MQAMNRRALPNMQLPGKMDEYKDDGKERPMTRPMLAALLLAVGLSWPSAPVFAQAAAGDEPPAAPARDAGPHPEFDADTDYAYWCNSTIRNLVMMDVLQEKHFKKNPQDVILRLDQRIGNVAFNLDREKVQKVLEDYNVYYMGDTVAFSTSKNPKDLRKDLRGCRQYF